MTGSAFTEAVAIDTNIFLHLLNRHINTDLHINRLLEHLQKEDVALIVDEKGNIEREYARRIIPILSGKSVTGNELYILRFWMQPEIRCKVAIAYDDRLMRAIKKVIAGNRQKVDRIFVYSAFRKGRPLISNDRRDIVHGNVRRRRSPKYRKLLRTTKGLRPEGAGILTSMEAYDEIS